MQAVPMELARQAWMDMPDAMLTPTQRALLKEHDNKVQVSAYICKLPPLVERMLFVCRLLLACLSGFQLHLVTCE